MKKRPAGSVVKRNEFGEKFCLGCSRWFPEEIFANDNSRPDKLKLHCRKCDTVRCYGLNAITFDQLLESQNGLCAVCQEESIKWHVDHDHSCCPRGKGCCGKCIRGILCPPCNLAEGLLRSDPTIISNLLEYVKNGGIK